MTSEMSILFPVMVTALVLAVLALSFGMLMSWRAMRRDANAQALSQNDGLAHLMGNHLAQIEAVLDRHAVERMTQHQKIAQDFETIQTDLEWLAGEKMIEQAISLVRENMPLSQISRETGLPHDTIRTIATFRPH